MKPSLRLLSLVALTCLVLASPGKAADLSHFHFEDQYGKPFTLEKLRGKFVLVSFIYTRCPMPKMCPLTVELNRELVAALKTHPKLPPVALVLVTLDPAYDRPGVLSRFFQSKKLDEKWVTLLTGSEPEITRFASEFNVVGLPANGGLSHNAKSILLGPKLEELHQFKDNDWKPADVIRWLERKGRSSS